VIPAGDQDRHGRHRRPDQEEHVLDARDQQETWSARKRAITILIRLDELELIEIVGK
jgi:hypothetical protein